MPKQYKIHLTKNAQNDLEHIFSYIASDSINNAKKFIIELEKKVYRLDTSPERCPYIPENMFFGVNYRHLIHNRYRIIYKVDNNCVFILRVVHGSKSLDL